MYRRILSIAFAASLSLLALPATIADAGTTAVPALNHVYLIVGENTSLSQITKTHAPFQTSWVKPNSAWLTNYWGISHYSTSNYIAMTSGQFLHCHQLDEKPATGNQDVDNLFNQLTPGVSWLEWNESMPQPCYLVNAGSSRTGNSYRVKHHPAAYNAGQGGSPNGTKNYGGGNTPFAAIGDPVVPGVDGSFANHYSLLRTLEDAFGITTHLGGAATASTLGNIWAP